MHVVIVKQSLTGQVVCEWATVAANFWTRLRGLLGRSGLLPGEGLWIVPSTGVHTFGMRFAIDVIMLDSNHRVLSLHTAVKPGKIIGMRCGAASALELGAGGIGAAGLSVGDRLSVTTR